LLTFETVKRTSLYKIIVPILLSFIMVVLVAQQIRFVLAMDSYAFQNVSEDGDSDEDTDENTSSSEFFKLIEQDKCLLASDFTMQSLTARSKSYSARRQFVSIESVIGAIDAPPPEKV
jgi:hypothetical protein